MHYAQFKSFCPFELGDIVKIKLHPQDKAYLGGEYTIDDILAIHSVRTGQVTFNVILIDENGKKMSPVHVSVLELVRYKAEN